jgi:hypothetical protein
LSAEFAAVWLTLLHDLGDLMYYGDVEGLKNIVVLRPDWLTGAIAQILDDAEVLKKRGVLEHTRLPELWRKYDAALHPFLHAVMEQFDICCREHEGQKWSLVGEKVPHERPEDIPESTGHELRMVYEFDEEPPGLMPWLIVRNYRFTTNKHWRFGAYLKHNEHGALVEFDRGTRRLSLNVHGAVPLNFFALLQDGVEQVLPRWKGLKDKVRQLIPCGQTRKDGKPCDRFFCLPDLKAAAKDEEPLQCNGCRKMADVSLLLAGIGVRQEPIMAQMSALLDEKLEPLRQLFQHGQRTLLRALTNISKDAPRLFSMWPKATEDKSWWERLDPRKLGTRTYEVWLWCEHCEQPHPVKRYEVSIPAEWMVKIAPYTKMIATAIKVGLPVLGAGLGIYLDQIGASKEDKKDIKERIEQMSKLAEKCLSGELDTDHKRKELTDGFSAPEGAALREFHTLLRDIDKPNHWGDLRPTPTNGGRLPLAVPRAPQGVQSRLNHHPQRQAGVIPPLADELRSCGADRRGLPHKDAAANGARSHCRLCNSCTPVRTASDCSYYTTRDAARSRRHHARNPELLPTPHVALTHFCTVPAPSIPGTPLAVRLPTPLLQRPIGGLAFTPRRSRE